MPDLLDATIEQLQGRVRELSVPAHEHPPRPPDALAALQAVQASTATQRVAGPAAGGQTQSGRVRKPRGANRDAILKAIGDRPGVTAAEVAQATGIDKNVVYATLSGLVKTDGIQATVLPSGRKGYKVAKGEQASSLRD